MSVMYRSGLLEPSSLASSDEANCIMRHESRKFLPEQNLKSDLFQGLFYKCRLSCSHWCMKPEVTRLTTLASAIFLDCSRIRTGQSRDFESWCCSGATRLRKERCFANDDFWAGTNVRAGRLTRIRSPVTVF